MRRLPIDLDEVADALEDDSSDNSYFLDVDSGAVIALQEETRSALERVLGPDVDGEEDLRLALAAGRLPDWQNAEVIAAYRVLESRRDCYLEIPFLGNAAVLDDMRAFAGTVEDPGLQSALREALDGRGAARRFKDRIWTHETESRRWHEYRRRRARDRALAWLAAEGIAAGDAAGAPVPENDSGETGRVIPFRPPEVEAEYQLRIYDIVPGGMDEFVALFRRIAEIRRSVGFEVIGPWIDDATNQFVWIAGFRGPQGFEAANRAYRESPERSGLRPDPAAFIAHMETRMLRSV